ncbi:hypothetical protein BTZ20_0751 [Rhodococcus sp. MTM3W5.2]|uniref:hypothetical protein n=1 Tax=Rhodococcus sp. MTM3W5.2 TaxID=1805827 RepID=UPI0009791DE9|nr:hypothetical protein [Rhodococcus sp. MTM3W5.2]AQA20947.1 hypothetical protein BTZ20_0751 [Rhodococcus sp. MTM3W5.2]
MEDLSSAVKFSPLSTSFVNEGVDTLLNRICVRAPYFALQDFVVPSDGTVTCNFPTEVDPGDEGPITMAELARHSAIAGLCAVASSFDDGDRRYYLARTGTMTRLSDTAYVPGAAISAKATGALTSQRTAKAQCTVTMGGRSEVRMEIGYSVFTESAFDKFFGYLRRDTDDHLPSNPYSTPMPMQDVHVETSSATAVSSVSPEQCIGHFSGYPAMPIAYLLSAKFELGAILASEILAGRRAILESSELIDTRALIPPNTRVDLSAVVEHGAEDSCTINLSTTVSGEVAVLARASYRPV